jgi:LysM repeat protein
MRTPATAFLLISSFFVKTVLAQSNELIVEGQTGKLYLVHTVVARDNWYSIGRLYNVNPKTVAPFNNLTMDKPLEIGQQIEVPLTAVNFSQTGQKTAGETLLPVYHIIQEKEWMYRISVNHNKVPIGSLEKWNHLTKGEVKAGMHLVVGFLKVRTALSALAKETPPAGLVAPPLPTVNAPIETKPVVSKVIETKPVVVKPETVKIEEGKKTDEVKKTDEGKKTEAVVKEEKRIEPVVKEETKPAEPMIKVTTKTFNGGYFRSDYTPAGKSAMGMAGTFKSTSGWQDGKYYALMNNLAVGTIVKVSLPSTNKSVYVKILGSLPDMKESAGLAIRISNAAAGELGSGDGKFNAEINY